MSGSGGGSSGGYYEPELTCQNIGFTTDVNSPQPDAISGIKLQDKLDVRLENNVVVLVRRDTGDIVGSINWTNILKLLECLIEGFRYVAVVKEIRDGLLKVSVSAQKDY